MLSKEDNDFLALYSDSEYDKPSVTVDAVIFRIVNEENKNYRKLANKKLQVYLTKRQFSPFKEQYSIVGTFIDLKNELNETMKLCVKNKVNLTNFYDEQLFTFGEKSRDPRTRVLSVSYLLLTNGSEELFGGEWFDVNLFETKNSQKINANGYTMQKTYNLSFSNGSQTLENVVEVNKSKNGLLEEKSVNVSRNSLAFDHTSIIFYALERLKNKLEYTDIIFNLMPKEFTLTELKQCYELILQKPLLDANFRRKISKMVLAIDKFDEAKGHRTSQLFVHNPNWLTSDVE